MKYAVHIISLIAFASTLLPCIIYFNGGIDHDSVKILALVGTAFWFAATPFWMGRKAT